MSYLKACTSTVDVYEARCPEGVYTVFMDMDFCGPGERWGELVKHGYPAGP